MLESEKNPNNSLEIQQNEDIYVGNEHFTYYEEEDDQEQEPFSGNFLEMPNKNQSLPDRFSQLSNHNQYSQIAEEIKETFREDSNESSEERQGTRILETEDSQSDIEYTSNKSYDLLDFNTDDGDNMDEAQ